MLNRPLEEIEAAAINQLIAEKVAESKTLEYKRDLPGSQLEGVLGAPARFWMRLEMDYQVARAGREM